MADTMRTSPGAGFGDGSNPTQANNKSGDLATRTIEDAKEMGGEMLAAARDSATSLLDEQRFRAADEISALGEVLRRSARALDESGNGAVVRYAEEAASQIGSFADGLRNRSWGELGRDVEDFARSWPMAFTAGAITAGFVAGRFLISSAPRRTEQNSTPSFQPRPMGEPQGGARHDYGRVSGEASGIGQAGYGAGMTRETP